MLSKEEVKKLRDEFVAIPPSGSSFKERRRDLLKKYAGDYVEFDGGYMARQVDLDCPWEILFTILSTFEINMYLKFRTGNGLFEHVSGMYDDMRLAIEDGYYGCFAKYSEVGNVVIASGCVEQSFGDEDGFGMDPDVYIEAMIDSTGKFVVPFHLA